MGWGGVEWGGRRTVGGWRESQWLRERGSTSPLQNSRHALCLPLPARPPLLTASRAVTRHPPPAPPQNDFLRPFVVVMRHSRAVEIRELIIRCVSQMVLARVANVKSGWKSMFMVRGGVCVGGGGGGR